MTGWSSKPEWPELKNSKTWEDEVNKAFEQHFATDAIEAGVNELANKLADNILKEKVYNNLSPTHDPYTNPYIYHAMVR